MSSNQLDKKSQAWSALFSEPMSELVKRYTASVDFDQRMWRHVAPAFADAHRLRAQLTVALYEAQQQEALASGPKVYWLPIAA